MGYINISILHEKVGWKGVVINSPNKNIECLLQEVASISNLSDLHNNNLDVYMTNKEPYF